MSQVVYAMEDRKTGLWKIGISIDPDIRASRVSKEFGCDARVLGILRVEDAAKTEKFIHGMLSDNRVVGEWFEVPEKKRAYILAYFSEKLPKKEASPRPEHPLIEGESAASQGGAKWKLKELLEREGATAYQLAEKMGGPKGGAARRPTLYAIVSTNPKSHPANPSFKLLEEILMGLHALTGKRFSVSDIVESSEYPEATA